MQHDADQRVAETVEVHVEAPTLPSDLVGIASGQLTPGWRTTVAVVWTGIMVAMATTAGASDVMNRPVWWLGSTVDRAPLWLTVIPFLLPVATVVMAMRNTRRVTEVSAAASASTAVVALVDVGEAPAAALVIGVLALAGALVTVASIAGRIRPA